MALYIDGVEVLNANQLDGINLDTTGLANNFIIYYDSASGTWKVSAPGAVSFEIIYSDESDAGASIAEVGGLITAECNAGTADLVRQDGTDILHSTYACSGTQCKAALFVNGVRYVQIDQGIGITPAIGQWGLDTTVGSEAFVIRTSAAGTDTYSIGMSGEKA